MSSRYRVTKEIIYKDYRTGRTVHSEDKDYKTVPKSLPKEAREKLEKSKPGRKKK